MAEALFNKQGFDGALMRDIATAAKMQPASVYYYFESKEELLWAVWEKGGLELVNRVIDAIADKTDPWQRMETACVAHTTGLLDWRRANQALFIMPPWHYPDGIKARVIALRDEYENIFIGLIDDLPLRKGVDRRYLRLTVIGALSWSLFWFKKERDTPATIAKQILSMLRVPASKTLNRSWASNALGTFGRSATATLTADPTGIALVGRCDKTLADSSLAALFKTNCPRSRLGGTARSNCRPDPGSSISAPRFRVSPAQDPPARLCFADRHVRRRYRRSAG